MRKQMKVLAGAALLVGLSASSSAQTLGTLQDRANDGLEFPMRNMHFEEFDDGSILVATERDQHWFPDPAAYMRSAFFQKNNLRCGTDRIVQNQAQRLLGSQSDCASSSTTISSEYNASGESYVIPVVFHVLINNNGAGNVSDALLMSQLDILNEDFQALGGTPGAGGNNANVSFCLAGITRTVNRNWYNDRQNYWDTLSWDVNTYLNIYTNTAGGNLGYAYVPNQGGIVGSSFDRVVLYWPAVGRNAPYGPPYDQGRSGTHEVGHYLGLQHTFNGGCDSGNCYQDGDFICDTNDESGATFGCPGGQVSCGSTDPIQNYMDYTDDTCMTHFTSEQVNRMRCTLANWRVDTGNGCVPNNDPPGAATNPSPSNGATGVSTSMAVSWTAGSDADSHDVYFGTDSTPDAGEFQGGQAGTNFNPGTLAASTTYYWRIDEVNTNGTTTGSVWSFTTAGGGGGLTLSTNGYKVKGKHTIDLSWSGASGSNVEIYRDGNLIATTANDGAYTDATGNKGGATYVYQVCETGGGACSNTSTVVF